MPSGSAGRRYAQAIFELAREQNNLEQWASNLETIAYTFSQPEVQTFLENPKTSREKKTQFARTVLGTRVGPEALNLALLLIQRDRQNYVPGIYQEYIRLWNKLRGIEIAEVTTAVPVGPKEEELIRQRLSAITGKQITLKTNVDPEIMGGLVARVGDTLIDGSIRTRLQNLRKQLA
ncbi:MAG TPA: ATP synthase F1 subunit delta [Chloroflexia bacterium]|nr:ATP synthase F1 subunit delta [Chloroflexia bacterium]